MDDLKHTGPYYIEKGSKPASKKRDDGEFERALAELQKLVKENKEIVSEYLKKETFIPTQ